MTLELARAVGKLLLAQPRRWAWLPPAAWAAVIWALSARPVVPPPDPQLWRSFLWNNAHGPVFGLLALLLVPLAPRRGGWVRLGRRETAAIALGAALWAGIDELHQARVPGRTASGADFLTDLAGIAAALVLARYLSGPATRVRGLRTRLALGILACVLGATLATLEPFLVPDPS